MAENRELLATELSEINNYVRHHFQLFIGWYTFFLTVNFAAIGWFTSVLVTGAIKASLPIILVAGFFVIQQLFSFVASLEVRKYFAAATSRSQELLHLLGGQEADSRDQPKCPIPLGTYVKIINLICATLVSFVLFWIGLSVVSLSMVPLR